MIHHQVSYSRDSRELTLSRTIFKRLIVEAMIASVRSVQATNNKEITRLYMEKVLKKQASFIDQLVLLGTGS